MIPPGRHAAGRHSAAWRIFDARRRPAAQAVWSRPLGARLVIASVTAVLLIVSGWAASAQEAAGARWVAGPGSDAAQVAPIPAVPNEKKPAAPGPNGAGRPTSSGRPAPSGSPRPEPSSSSTPTLKDYLEQIPAFPPAPAPEKLELPVGPDAAWLSRIPTSQPVAFITIDDGWQKRPEAVELLKKARVPVTLFLTINAIRSDPAYFKRLEAAGAVIEAHSITHANLAGKAYDFQKREICGSADQLGVFYGRRPTLFRPPFGSKDATTLRAAHDCGIKAAFFWKQNVEKGVVEFQQGNTVQPGDIILMHFRTSFAEDFLAALQAIEAAGLTPALLEDYVP